MTARALLRWVLLLQACAVLSVAYLAHGAGLRWPLALLAALGVVILVRMLITANNFLLTRPHSSPTPEEFLLAPGARLRLFAEEFMATMLQTSWFMTRASSRETLFPDAPGVPVLLLHGYGCNSGYWAHLTPLLAARHISHATLDLEPLMGAIDEYVPLVQRAVDRLCQQSGAPAVIIVAHSMGGLVARAYLRAHGPARVRHVFTLGTPHHGTSLAQMGVGKNAAQMRRSADATSDWLRELSMSETPQLRALFTSLYTHHDNIVAPQTSSVLPDAHNIAFGGVGHVAMGRNPRVLGCLIKEIERLFAH
ncbi:MAG TPA: alpha/beta fold hydrolase [Telluria sp.]|jgi:triacylglycerol esterase/lipase EstA (alpha/beta hydrolase family)